MIKTYKLVIFDLDGTLTPERPSSAAPFERRLLPGVREKCRELREQGALLAILTNQRHGDRNREELNTLAQWLFHRIQFNLSRVLTHKAELKPSPEGIYELCRLGATKETATLMVGDSPDDQEAALAAGVDFEWAKDFFGWENEPKN